MANVSANINVNIQTQQAAAQLRKLSADISRFNQQSFAANSAAAQQQRALNQALIDGVRASGHFRTSIVPMNSAVENFSRSIEKSQLTLGQYTRYAASQLPGMRRVFTREFDMINRVAERRVKLLNTQFVALGESANGMQQALAMTPRSLDQFAARSAIALQRQQIFNRLLRDGSTQLLNWGKNTQWAGRQLMVGFTIPLGLLGAQAAKVFRELEAEAVNFRKVYGDMFTTDVEVEKNLAAIKELSMEMTKYGQTAQQTMQLANTAAQAGARGAELMAATKQATRLAILGQMEQNQAIETTISLQTAFAMSNEELAESINFLNSVENQTILSLQDVSEAIPRVASVIKGFGGDVEDLAVLLVAMKEGGVSAAEGANALKNSMARVISPTKRALETSAKYGIALQDIVARNEGKVVPLFQELAKALEAVGGQERQEILSDIFGKFQYARIGTLLSNIAKDGSQAAKAIELTGVATRDLAATAERELSAVEDAVGTKFTAALEKAKIALAPVGEEFLKALTPILNSVGSILDKFNELPGGIKTAIVAATGIIGGIAPIVLMVVGLVANGIANIGKFILFLRKQVAVLRGNGEQFKYYAEAELQAAAAANSLEGKTSSLTRTMLLQKPAIESLITLYQRLATSAAAAAARMPATMGGIGVPMAGPRGGGFAAVAPRLPVAYRNTGGPIFESTGGKTIVPGTGNTDTVPAMLTPGEFVINKKATQQNLPLIKAINDGSINVGSAPEKIPSVEPQVQSAFTGLRIAALRLRGMNVGAHASNPVLLTGRRKVEFLAGAERALVQSNRSAKVFGLDTTMLNIDDAFNQAMKRGGKGVEDRLGFSKHIRKQQDLFSKMPAIDGLSKTTKERFKSIIAQEVAKSKRPITDARFADAYEKAVQRMRSELEGKPNVLKNFNSAIEKTQQLSQTRVVFNLPKGVSAKTYAGAEAARKAMRSQGLMTSVKSGNPFYYYDKSSRKLSAIVWNPETGSYVSVTTDSTRQIAKSRLSQSMNVGGEIQKFNSGGYVGSSSMYDPRYMQGSSGSQTVNRMNNYKQYVSARRNVKATTSYRDRNRKLIKIRPPKPRTAFDYAVPKQSRFVSVPIPMPFEEKTRLPMAQDLTGKFVRDVPGTSVGSRYQYTARPQTGIPTLDNLMNATGLKNYNLTPAPPNVLRDKYGRSIARDEFNKREQYRNVLRFESNPTIRKAMRQSEMKRRRMYRLGAFTKFGGDAVRKKDPLYQGGPGVSSRLGQNRGMAELARDKSGSGEKPIFMRMPDTRTETEKTKSFKVAPGETILLPNGQTYTNDSRNTKYIPNPYYRKDPGKQWVDSKTLMSYDLGGQADVDLKTTFPSRRLAGAAQDANIPELARLGIPWAEKMSQQVHRTGPFGVPGFNKGGMIPGVQYFNAAMAQRVVQSMPKPQQNTLYHRGNLENFQTTMPVSKSMNASTMGPGLYADPRMDVVGKWGKQGDLVYKVTTTKPMLDMGENFFTSQAMQRIYPKWADNLKRQTGVNIEKYLPFSSNKIVAKIRKLFKKYPKITISEVQARVATDLASTVAERSGISRFSKDGIHLESMINEQFRKAVIDSGFGGGRLGNINAIYDLNSVNVKRMQSGPMLAPGMFNAGGTVPEMSPTISAPLVKEWAQRKSKMMTSGLSKQTDVLMANAGTQVPGVGNTDTVPAMLTPGEFVVNKEASQKNLPLLHAINDGQTQFLQRGGQSSNPYKQGFLRQIRGIGDARLRAAFERQYLLSAIGGEAAFKATGSAGYRMPAYGHFADVDKGSRENWRLGGRRSPGMPISPAENQLQESLRSSSRNRAMFEKYLKQELGSGSKADRQTQKIMQKLEKNQMLSAKETAIQSKVLSRMIPDMEKGIIKATEKPIKGQETVSKNLLRTMQGALASYNARDAAATRLAKMEPGYRARVVERMLSIRASGGVGPKPDKPLIKPANAQQAKNAKEQAKQSARQQRLEAKTARQEQERAARQAKLNDTQRRALEIKKQEAKLGRQIGTQEALQRARAELGIKPPATGGDVAPKQSMYSRMNAGVGKFGMGAGMAVSMAGMMPMMMADKETGKFMGMDAGTAMMGMMGAGTLLSIAPMLGSAALPVIALGATAAAVGIGLKMWRNNVDEAAKKTAELGANMGGTANALNTMSSLFGEQTPTQRRAKMQMGFTEEEQEQSFGEFQNYLGSEAGASFLKDLENATSAERFSKLSSYLANAVAGGILDENQARLFAKTVSAYLNDAVLGSTVIKAIQDQKVGAEGLLELAEKRLSAVEKSASVQKLQSEATIEETDASSVIGSSIQIIQEFANVEALAKEEYAAGIQTFKEYRDMVNRARDAQEQYTRAMENAFNKTEDFGATMQAWRDQLILSGKSPEVIGAFERAAKKTVDYTPSGVGLGPDERVGLGIFAAFKQGFSDQASFGSVWSALVSGKVTQIDEELAAALSAASLSGEYNDADIAAIAEKIVSEPAGRFAEVFEQYGRGERGLGRALFEQKMQNTEIPGLDEEGTQRYIDLAFRFDETSGDIVDFETFVANIPEEKIMKVLVDFENLSAEGMSRIVADQTRFASMFGMETANEIITESPEYQQNIEKTGRVIPRRGRTEYDPTLGDALTRLYENLGSEGKETIDYARKQENDLIKLSDVLNNISETVEWIDMSIPKEMQIGLGIDVFDPKQMDDLNKYKEALGGLADVVSVMTEQEQGIAARIAISMVNGENKPLTAEELVSQTTEIVGAIKNLDSKDLNVRKQAMLTIIQSYENEDGTRITPEQSEQFMAEWAEKFDAKKISLLNEVEIGILTSLETEITGQEEALKNLREARKFAMVAGEDAKVAEIDEQIASINAMISGKKEAQRLTVERAGTAKGPGGGGGGGGTQSPVQGFIDNILNQFKMWVDASAKMTDLNNARSNFIDNVLKGDSLFKKLDKVKGIDPARLQEILGMGPEGAKEFLDKYTTKGGSLTKAGKGILDAAVQAGIGQTIGTNILSAKQTKQQASAADFLNRRGEGSQVIQSIAGDPGKAAELLRLRKEYNQAVKGGNAEDIEKADKALNRYINSERKVVKAAKEREEALKSASQKAIDANNKTIEANNDAMEEGDYYFDQQTKKIERNYRDRVKAAEDEIESLNDQIDAVNKLIEEQEKLNRADQNRIRGLERQKEMLSRQLEELDRANELDERRIQTLQRDDEIRSRVADALERELELMSREEEKIRDAYEKRLEALDEVAKINDYIIDQQRQQIDLSRAIAEGDIYSATAAAQGMRASSAQFATEQVRSGLEQGMENQIAGLTTSEGLTRVQAEQQIQAIQDQSYQTSLMIRDIEDAIYQRNLQMIPIKDQMRNIDLQIRGIQDEIYNRETLILGIQTQQLEPLQTSLTNQQTILNNLNDQIEKEIESLTYLGMTSDEWIDHKDLLMDQNRSLEKQNEILQEEDERLAGISKKWNRITRQIMQANKVAAQRKFDIEAIAAADIEAIQSNTNLSDETINSEVRKRREKRRQDLAALEAKRQSETDALLASGSNISAFAGGMIKYATGGMIANPTKFTSREAPPMQKRSIGGPIFGNGSRDSIAAMLTPGEFVIRKAMVEKYGIPLMQALNQGSFEMPRYDTGQVTPEVGIVSSNNVSNINAPVYNTYDIKFAVNGTNASVDEIANKVMFKMNQVQNQAIRSNRGY